MVTSRTTQPICRSGIMLAIRKSHCIKGVDGLSVRCKGADRIII